MNENATKIGIKFQNNVSGQKKLDTLASSLEKIKTSLNSIDGGTLQKIAVSTNQVKEARKQTEKLSKKVKSTFDNSLIAKFLGSLQKVTTTMKSLSKYTTVASDYYENWNLFQNAFQRGGKVAINTASDFVETMSKMYGLDESWGYKTVGIFKELSSAMGIAEETGTRLSKLMLQMSLDISSLYNVDVERASSVLQSSLAGQTKPIRGLTGADITQATLQTTLDNLGIDKAIADLSYAEKRLIIIVSLTEQLRDSIGDMADTIESPANQTRVLASQWERLTRAVGNVFLPIMAKVLPYLNAVLMVLTDILNIIADIMADIFHFDKEQFNIKGVADTSDVVDGLADNLDTATGNANNLKDAMSGLRGFDKLNNLTTPKDTGEVGGGAGGVSSDILDAFNKAYAKYQTMLSDVKMKATEIADKIREWLGITDGSYKNLKRISAVLGIIVGGAILGKIVTFIGKIAKSQFSKSLLLGIELFSKNTLTLKSILGIVSPKIGNFIVSFEKVAGVLGLTSPQLLIIIGIITALATAFTIAYNTSDTFKEKVDLMVKNVLNILTIMKDTIFTIIKSIWELIEPIWKIIKDTIILVVEGIYTKVKYYFSLILDVFNGTCKFITDLINGDFDKAFDDLGEMAKNLKDDWKTQNEENQKNFKKFSEKIKEHTTDLKDKFLEKMGKIEKALQEAPEKFGKWMGEAVGNLIKKITEIDWEKKGKDIISDIIKGLKSIPDIDITEWAKNFGKKVAEKISNIDWKQIGINILDGIVKGMIGVKASTFVKFTDNFIKGLKESLGIHSPAKAIIDAKIGDYSLMGIIEGMNNAMPLLSEETKDIVDTINTSFSEIKPITGLYDSSIYTSGKIASENVKTYINQNQEKNLGQYKMPSSTYNIYVGTEKVAQVVLNQFDKMARENGKPIEITA